MITLNQINILEKITPKQEDVLKGISGECHINGKIYVRKMKQEFNTHAAMMDFKSELCNKVGLVASNVILIFTEK